MEQCSSAVPCRSCAAANASIRSFSCSSMSGIDAYLHTSRSVWEYKIVELTRSAFARRYQAFHWQPWSSPGRGRSVRPCSSSPAPPARLSRATASPPSASSGTSSQGSLSSPPYNSMIWDSMEVDLRKLPQIVINYCKLCKLWKISAITWSSFWAIVSLYSCWSAWLRSCAACNSLLLLINLFSSSVTWPIF